MVFFCYHRHGGRSRKRSDANSHSDSVILAPPGGQGKHDFIRPIGDSELHSARASSLVSIIQEPDEGLSEKMSANHSFHFHSQSNREMMKKFQTSRRNRDETRRNRRKRPKQLQSLRENTDPYEAEGKLLY